MTNILENINSLILEVLSGGISKLNFLNYNSKEDLERVNNIHNQYRKSGNYEKILQNQFPDYNGKTDEDFIYYYNENQKEIINRIKIDGKRAENNWDNNFFSKISNITGFDWDYSKYECSFSAVWVGGGGYIRPNKIIICPFRIDTNALIGHELFHLHYWDIIDNIYPKGKVPISINKLWDLSEVVVNYPLEEIKMNGYKERIMSQHKSLHSQVYPLWKNRNSYEEFIREAIERVNGK